MGLLDNVLGSSFDDPRTAATLQLAQGLLSSPRMMQGLAGGLSGYQQAMAQAKQAKAVEEMRAMQLQQMQMQMAAQRQQQEQAQRDREGMQKFLSPVMPIEANAASGITGPRPEALKAVGQLPPLDPRLMAGFQMSPDAIKQAFEISQLGVKKGPEYSPTVQYDQEGRAFLVAKDGSHKYIDGVKARDKLITEDLGGAKVLRTEYSPEVRGQYGKTYTPDALLGAATTRRGQDLKFATDKEANDINKQAARTQVVTDPQRGIFLVDKGTSLVTPGRTLDGKPVPGADQVASIKRVDQLRAGIEEARNLLKKDPTGSYAGAGIDQGARVFGLSTQGGRTASQLETLAGWMVANVPRMEGPQSNIDVENYKIMAGRVGDRTLPVRERMEALDALERLQNKYANLNGGSPSWSPSAAAGGAPVLRYNPQTGSFE